MFFGYSSLCVCNEGYTFKLNKHKTKTGWMTPTKVTCLKKKRKKKKKAVCQWMFFGYSSLCGCNGGYTFKLNKHLKYSERCRKRIPNGWGHHQDVQIKWPEFALSLNVTEVHTPNLMCQLLSGALWIQRLYQLMPSDAYFHWDEIWYWERWKCWHLRGGKRPSFVWFEISACTITEL